MSEHNHILRRASYPGDCPACDVVWDAIRIPDVDRLLHFDQEFAVALSLRSDYSEIEMHFHLDDIMAKGQALKYKMGL